MPFVFRHGGSGLSVRLIQLAISENVSFGGSSAAELMGQPDRLDPGARQTGKANSYRGAVLSASSDNTRYCARTPLPRKNCLTVKPSRESTAWEPLVVPHQVSSPWLSQTAIQPEESAVILVLNRKRRHGFNPRPCMGATVDDTTLPPYGSEHNKFAGSRGGCLSKLPVRQ